ncbi:enoyl-CoA hydratase/isomerase family protein [Arthrobacter sp. Sa2BUA2]|uniref:3-hydroxyisobutyryl-CoA hydrolase n=1 Tax=Arthrobacter pullicola TaxID=2762224 RepID=A0ABR8YF09_9MICC|nr:3-hydroxyisobutyryl-CoA hydrolase [Arthrobacter pullicola]MBD8042817.1 enoyl-CoA hydratase/isomerase family protein [Arthrobacter pullicola]
MESSPSGTLTRASIHATGELQAWTSGNLGIIRLNRPQALNAMTVGMVTAMDRVLQDWASADTVGSVLLLGAGDRGLCAGGDIRAIAAGTDAQAMEFWTAEYALNARVAHFPKPYVALMDGVVMGGGVGVSGHAGIRIATERTQAAMPEVRIGFSPDCAGSLLLARAPGELGTHLALTAGTMTGADAVLCGFADYFVPSASLPALCAALETGEPEQTVAAFAVEPPPAPLAGQREWIDECYAGSDVQEILARLDSHASPEATAAARDIRAMAPFSLAVALAAVRAAAAEPVLEKVLERDLVMAERVIARPDFREGVRARLLDRDAPRWQPASLAEVAAADVAWTLAL